MDGSKEITNNNEMYQSPQCLHDKQTD